MLLTSYAFTEVVNDRCKCTPDQALTSSSWLSFTYSLTCFEQSLKRNHESSFYRGVASSGFYFRTRDTENGAQIFEYNWEVSCKGKKCREYKKIVIIIRLLSNRGGCYYRLYCTDCILRSFHFLFRRKLSPSAIQCCFCLSVSSLVICLYRFYMNKIIDLNILYNVKEKQKLCTYNKWLYNYVAMPIWI